MSSSTDDPLPRALSSFDARRVPIIEIDTHLPGLRPEQMGEGGLRSRFVQRARQPWRPELLGDAASDEVRPRAAAAVLIPLVVRPEGAQVLLTRRAAHLRHHAGQISFPGGRAEPWDAGRVDTALREAHEEIGLAPSDVEVLGPLPPYRTVTAFDVTPVVGLIREVPPLKLDAQEVAEVFEVPLAFLMNPAQHRRHRIELGEGRFRQFLSMQWRAQKAESEADYFIWGATAAMLRNLYRYLQD